MISYMHRVEAKWLLIGAVIGYAFCAFDGTTLVSDLLAQVL